VPTKSRWQRADPKNRRRRCKQNIGGGAISAGLYVCGTCPAYFKDVCVPLAAITNGRTSLRAADRGDILVPSTKTKIGGRSFRVIWNSLPHYLHNKTITKRQFKSGLKMFNQFSVQTTFIL